MATNVHTKPACPEHPNGRVRKHGTYGSKGQYVKWECVPDNDETPHMIKMGGANRARFSPSVKAATLVRLANGESYREASSAARKMAGTTMASRDAHTARNWTRKYTPILARHYQLPKAREEMSLAESLDVLTSLARRGCAVEEEWMEIIRSTG